MLDAQIAMSNIGRSNAENNLDAKPQFSWGCVASNFHVKLQKGIYNTAFEIGTQLLVLGYFWISRPRRLCPIEILLQLPHVRAYKVAKTYPWEPFWHLTWPRQGDLLKIFFEVLQQIKNTKCGQLKPLLQKAEAKGIFPGQGKEYLPWNIVQHIV